MFLNYKNNRNCRNKNIAADKWNKLDKFVSSKHTEIFYNLLKIKKNNHQQYLYVHISIGLRFTHYYNKIIPVQN